MTIQTRKLGTDGPTVAAIGVGCMRMTALGHGNHQGDEAGGIAALHAMLEQGPTLVNTGDFYSMGANEMLVGKAIKGRRDRAVLSVKMGAMRAPGGQFLGLDLRPNTVKNHCSYSLQRLGVDHIDLYQPARVDPAVPVEDTVGAIADLIKEGKVRYLGVSEYNAEQLRRAHAVHPVTALEIEYSLACRFIEQEILPTARELGIGLVPYSVVTQGLLTGEFPAEMEPGDVRGVLPRFQGEALQNNLAVVKRLTELAQRKSATPAQVAVAWVLAQYQMAVPVIGMSKPARVADNLGALDVQLTPEDLSMLDEAFAPGAIVGDRVPGPMKHMVAS